MYVAIDSVKVPHQRRGFVSMHPYDVERACLEQAAVQPTLRVGVGIARGFRGPPIEAEIARHRIEELTGGLELRLHAGPILGIEVHVLHPLASFFAVQLGVRNRENPKEWVSLTFNGSSFPHEDMTVDLLAEMLRRTCRWALEHELDEGLFVEGQRRFDPHALEFVPAPVSAFSGLDKLVNERLYRLAHAEPGE